MTAGVLLAAYILSTVCASLLVHGAKTVGVHLRTSLLCTSCFIQANVCMMKPWIVLAAIGLILDIFYNLMALVALATADVICSVIAWIIGAYFFLVVWNLKKEIEDSGPGGSYTGEVHSKREEREMMNTLMNPLMNA